MTAPSECPCCGADLRAGPIDPKYFVHHHEADPSWDRGVNMSHEEQIRRWGRCHCLPYGDRPVEERFYRRVIGVEVGGVYDGILFWRCPDCGGEWHRWQEERMRAKAEQHMTPGSPHP